MKKAIFNYKKDDGSIKQRVVFKPSMLKESSNSLKDFENPNVKYLTGYEIDKTGMDSTIIDQYEKLISQYMDIQFPTLEQFLESNGLDPKKIQQKTFKKEGVLDLQILT